MTKILFIGNIQREIPPTGGGAQAKNQLFLNFLQERFGDVAYYDTWHKNRIVSLLIICLRIIFSPNKKTILSLSFDGVYLLSKILTIIRIKRNIYYWVVGGDIVDKMKNNKEITLKYLNCFSKIIVEATYIANGLKILGIKNIKVIPNFKKIDYIPNKAKRCENKFRFVYLGRLIEEKGVGLIVEAIRQLEGKNFEVDFYGSLSSKFSIEYFDKIDLKNVCYKGFLDLQNKKNYDILASYDVMIFPTYFLGEGFPGVIIDAFIAGLPVITTDFHANPEIIVDGKNGILIPPKHLDKLKEVMNDFICGKYDLEFMQNEALSSAKYYDIHNVLSNSIFTELDIL